MASSSSSMTEVRVVWQGIGLTVRCTPQRFTDHDHIEIESDGRVPLPITATGYRSHFLLTEEWAEFGDPGTFVRAWLDEAAETEEWRAYEAERRQLALF